MTEIVITNNEEVFEVVEETGRLIRINVSDVIYSVVPIGSRYESFTPTNGQTIFTLSEISTTQEALLSKVFINGQKIEVSQSYSIVGTQLTIILPYSLVTTDLLEIYY